MNFNKDMNVFEKKTNWETKTDETELHIFHIVKK